MENQIRKLDDYQEEGEGTNAEKLPRTLELNMQQLEALTYETFTKDYGDGKGQKTRFIISVGEKRYFAPQQVLSILKRAKNNPKLSRVIIDVSGTGIGTRYNSREVEFQ